MYIPIGSDCWPCMIMCSQKCCQNVSLFGTASLASPFKEGARGEEKAREKERAREREREMEGIYQ